MALRKRVPVAGGSGFFGAHLCERLLEDDPLASAFLRLAGGV